MKLKFFKNAAGEYHCPVMYKVYNNSTHIAVIKTTGHVFSYEAIEELNLKTKNFKDLLDDTPFTRQDILVIQVYCTLHTPFTLLHTQTHEHDA